jgi:hypothetical protein
LWNYVFRDIQPSGGIRFWMISISLEMPLLAQINNYQTKNKAGRMRKTFWVNQPILMASKTRVINITAITKEIEYHPIFESTK